MVAIGASGYEDDNTRSARRRLVGALRRGGIPELIAGIEDSEGISLPPWLRANFNRTDPIMAARGHVGAFLAVEQVCGAIRDFLQGVSETGDWQ